MDVIAVISIISIIIITITFIIIIVKIIVNTHTKDTINSIFLVITGSGVFTTSTSI